MKSIEFIIFVCLVQSFTHAQKKETKIELQTEVPVSSEKVLKRKVAIVRFSNETQYGKGIFYNKENDPMAKICRIN